MAENKVKEVANMLGVEIGVPFYIKYSNSKGGLINYNPYILRDDFLYDRDNKACPATLNYLLNGYYEIDKPILDDVEKRYLEGVLKPFKDSVLNIEKNQNAYGQWICIEFKEDNFGLPYFEKDTMYKGMELNKKHTIQELGLFEDEI